MNDEYEYCMIDFVDDYPRACYFRAHDTDLQIVASIQTHPETIMSPPPVPNRSHETVNDLNTLIEQLQRFGWEDEGILEGWPWFAHRFRRRRRG